jgi:hypothetical protein
MHWITLSFSLFEFYGHNFIKICKIILNDTFYLLILLSLYAQVFMTRNAHKNEHKCNKKSLQFVYLSFTSSKYINYSKKNLP